MTTPFFRDIVLAVEAKHGIERRRARRRATITAEKDYGRERA
jgi:hypothetical protein